MTKPKPKSKSVPKKPVLKPFPKTGVLVFKDKEFEPEDFSLATRIITTGENVEALNRDVQLAGGVFIMGFLSEHGYDGTTLAGKQIEILADSTNHTISFKIVKK